MASGVISQPWLMADGLMADLVLNHVSASHPWVRQFLRDEAPGRFCVLEAEPDSCWDSVVRPRSSALFTRLQGPSGQRQVWTRLARIRWMWTGGIQRCCWDSCACWKRSCPMECAGFDSMLWVSSGKSRTPLHSPS